MVDTGSLESKAECFSPGNLLQINNDPIIKCQEGEAQGACLEDI